MANFKRNRNDIYDYFAKNEGKLIALFFALIFSFALQIVHAIIQTLRAALWPY